MGLVLRGGSRTPGAPRGLHAQAPEVGVRPVTNQGAPHPQQVPWAGRGRRACQHPPGPVPPAGRPGRPGALGPCGPRGLRAPPSGPRRGRAHPWAARPAATPRREPTPPRGPGPPGSCLGCAPATATAARARARTPPPPRRVSPAEAQAPRPPRGPRRPPRTCSRRAPGPPPLPQSTRGRLRRRLPCRLSSVHVPQDDVTSAA